MRLSAGPGFDKFNSCGRPLQVRTVFRYLLSTSNTVTSLGNGWLGMVSGVASS